MRNRLFIAVASLSLAAVPASAQVAPVGNWGSLAPNSFGGSGIPTSAVMVGNGVGGVTIALSATQRLTGPNLGNDGAGTFYASAGYGVSPASTWNFDYLVTGTNISNYYYRLLYDVNPGSGVADYGSYTIPGAAFGVALNNGDSWNLSFPFLSAPSNANHTAPVGAYDPSAAGEYNFVLQQFDAQSNAMLDEVAINVEVSATPEPASLVLLGTGLVGIGAVVRRRRA